MGRAKLIAGILFAGVVITLVVHYRVPLSNWIVQTEKWIAELGVWGPLVFFGLYLLVASLFFPDSLLNPVAGAMFGMPIGFAIVIVGTFVVQVVAFWLSRHFFQHQVQKIVMSRSKLTAIQQAAEQQGFRLQFLLRILPLNPVVVSYVIGTTKTGFKVFLSGCLGLIPGGFVQVYCGTTAKHLIKAAGQPKEYFSSHSILVAAGLIVCLLLLAIVIHKARIAIAKAES